MNRLLHSGGIRVLLIAPYISGGALPVFATTTEEIIDEPIAASCGEIIIPENFKYEEQEEERTVIEDCDNPFNADTTVSYYPTVTINDAPVSPGGTVVQPIDTSVMTLKYTITQTDPALNYLRVDLYRQEGDDYYAEALRVRDRQSFPTLAPGRYVLAFSYESLSVIQSDEGLLRRLLATVVPVAQAYYEDYSQVYTLSFTVEAPPPPTPAGASSVLFLPGIQASRLYAGEDMSVPGWFNDIEKDELLWETKSNHSIAGLKMTDDGKSINNIYTKDIITAAFGVVDIYRDFAIDLFFLKERGTIFDYTKFAYDWRDSVFDVATKPVQYPNGEEKTLVDEIIRLANDSYTGKVTIIAHSNGGLVAKALLQEFGETTLADKVDKLVLIGTPQLGTPKSINAMLHGTILDGFSDTVLYDNQLVRDTIRNMPGTYTLLPSPRYFLEMANQPVVTNDGSVAVAQVSSYGSIISRDQLNNFLLDSKGTFLDSPSVYEPKALNKQLLLQAQIEQQILDTWIAPSSVEVYEVVGTGLPTIAGVEYNEYRCTGLNYLTCRNSVHLQPRFIFTNQGDQTVVVGSAAGYRGDKTLAVVDLELEGNQRFTTARNHSSLTESPAVQAFVDSVIKYPYLVDSVVVPEFTEVSSDYTIISTHSPVTPRIVMSDGRVIGIENGEVKEEVIGSQYFTLASTTYLILPKPGVYQIEISGDQTGIFTLVIEELSTNNRQSKVAEIVASTTASMQAKMTVSEEGYNNLLVDLDGDGVIDEEWTQQGELVVDIIDTYTYMDLLDTIHGINHRFTKHYLSNLAEKAKRYHDGRDTRHQYFKLEQLLLRLLDRHVSQLRAKGLLEESVANELDVIINYLCKT